MDHQQTHRPFAFRHSSPSRAWLPLALTIAGWAVNDAKPWDRVEVQLFVDGKFIGGCDIVREMHARGELKRLLDASFAA